MFNRVLLYKVLVSRAKDTYYLSKKLVGVKKLLAFLAKKWNKESFQSIKVENTSGSKKRKRAHFFHTKRESLAQCSTFLCDLSLFTYLLGCIPAMYPV